MKLKVLAILIFVNVFIVVCGLPVSASTIVKPQSLSKYILRCEKVENGPIAKMDSPIM